MSVPVERRVERPQFPAIADGDLEKLKAFMEWKHFPAGRLICEEGKPGDTMFFVEKGEVEFYTIKGKDRKVPVRTLRAGKFFGEGAVLRDDKTRSLHARAKTEVWAWELHRDRFEEVMHAHPEIAIFMLREMAHWLTTLNPPSIATQLKAERTHSENSVVRALRVIGSIPFLVVNAALALAWIGVNWRYPGVIDKPELTTLAVVLAIEAIVVTLLVLVKQNADEDDANRRADAILDNTDGTEREVKSLRASVNRLTETVAELRDSSTGAGGQGGSETDAKDK